MAEPPSSIEDGYGKVFQSIAVPKRYLLELIHEQLLVDGNTAAADALLRESGLDFEGLGAELSRDGPLRLAVREAIMTRRVRDAIDLIASSLPDLFNAQALLHAQLLQQLVIDHLVSCEEESILTAQQVCESELIPLYEAARMKASEVEPLIKDVLEETCLLTTFPSCIYAAADGASTSLPTRIRVLLSEEHRENTAALVNKALLTAAGISATPKLLLLLQMIEHSEDDILEALVQQGYTDLAYELQASSVIMQQRFVTGGTSLQQPEWLEDDDSKDGTT